MMKRKIAAMMTGVVLAMSATTLPAFANGSLTNTQPRSAGEQQTQVSPKTGDRMQQQKWSLDDKGVNLSELTPSERIINLILVLIPSVTPLVVLLVK